MRHKHTTTFTGKESLDRKLTPEEIAEFRTSVKIIDKDGNEVLMSEGKIEEKCSRVVYAKDITTGEWQETNEKTPLIVFKA